MLVFPDIDPIAFHLGAWPVHWYGLMYLAGFATFWWLGRLRAKAPASGWRPAEIDDLLFYAAIGVIAGGRLGYIVFYDLAHTASNPWNLFRIWRGGMSFHGGLIGVLVAVCWFARNTGRGFFAVTDFIAPLIPPGLGFGRLGNFINAELWGKTTTAPWGMVFPGAGSVPRHPSQLYQAFLEGLVLFAILWIFSARRRRPMAVSGVFLIGYGSFRFIVEFVRVPDAQLGYLMLDWVTMGQVLSAPMVLAGAALLVWSRKLSQSDSVAPPGAAPVVQTHAGGGRRRRARRR